MMDAAGMKWIPGNQGTDYPGNGCDAECCCDECDYMLCCLDTHQPHICKTGADIRCPHAGKSPEGTT